MRRQENRGGQDLTKPVQNSGERIAIFHRLVYNDEIRGKKGQMQFDARNEIQDGD